MTWLLLLAIAPVLFLVKRWLKLSAEIHTLSLFSIGISSFLWGFAIAPDIAQITLEVLSLGLLKLKQRNV